ncbi:phospholipase D-like domain-containing protein [Flammeovirgaceae bacterium SG7u.111]|nr:phospholipase D-like domain-containing protein [Flammeovirgaceae bacterium SG7u.132]WPO36383.1 phospholipase D-like domain-containing protein [Flammeovirgaceae bacterium SG7u.111]
MPFQAYFDGPDKYDEQFVFYKEGGSPHLLQKLLQLLEVNKNELLEVNLCWYLFNNQVLHSYLKKLASEGVKVNVITIPLEGYDAGKPQKLTALHSGKKSAEAYAKYDLAKEIFKEYYHSEYASNYRIYFFPHMYVRSERVKKFSRGAFPYSLHTKAAFIKKKNGSLLALSSSNLAVRDLVKYESLVVLENEQRYVESFERFFDDLKNNSIDIKNYKQEGVSASHSFRFLPPKSNYLAHFSSPFYRNSAIQMEQELLSVLSRAKRRIIVCAQHLAAFNFRDHKHGKLRGGILGAAIQMAKKGVEVTCLSQTFASENEVDSVGKKLGEYRKPANTSHFKAFFSELAFSPNTAYYVNKYWHSKFIIVDNLLVFCSYNFTPTQFIFLEKVKINSFKEMPNCRYKGTHCEVSAHVLIDDVSIVKQFINNLASVLKSKETLKVL